VDGGKVVVSCDRDRGPSLEDLAEVLECATDPEHVLEVDV
jgi:hypothetical protein